MPDTLLTTSSAGLAHELLTGRCVLPKPADQDSTLARHEAGVFSELQDDLRGSTSPSERNVLFNKRIAPLCQSFVLAIGQRMAFEAARQSTRVSSNVIDAFEKMCIAEDAAWYMEHLGLTRKHILGMEVDAYEALLPNLDGMLEKTGAKPFVTSPLVSDNEWEDVLSLCSKFASPGLGAKL
ncbi:acyl-CoA oxidase, putative [Metarhizium acridum CQMa 102]|uniref:Acyl-CoA oxidase, putative n=1 Tax=Metarhizium acridum (strain CQMa 102) TaxID=655827 RepID=E9EAM7_METAQ|nr:acyl-CoA oxidase, putative [Metarhizium acridum CQMa 102]EFY87027.1 acyl-CoA oxidase, putative [Metarhizium acridum CQMa 102]